MVTGSRELIREMNRRLVLETVINDGPFPGRLYQKNWDLPKQRSTAIVHGSAWRNNIIERESEAIRHSTAVNRSCYNSAVRTVILSLWISVWNVPC